jgi:hypothetical protein
MPPENFRQLTREQFEQVLEKFPFTRKIDAVHMHHTWSPDHADYRGLETIVGMWKFHTQTNGWSDIAQHISIAPDGTIWTGRNWNRSPASATGFNGSSAVGPFMFETIGNFDIGHDRLEGAQLDTVIEVIRLVQKKFKLSDEAIRFHRQMTDQKSCPGTGVKRDDILAKVKASSGSKDVPPPSGSRAPRNDTPFSSTMNGDSRVVDDTVAAMLGRGKDRGVGEETGELSEEHGPRETVTRDVDRAVDSRAGVRALFTAEDLSRLAPHVVNLNQGELSSGGVFQTSPGDVDAIFAEHIPAFAKAQADGKAPLRIVFFAHGGLVGEGAGLAVARKHVEWWKANGVYPIYFVWETGLCETLGQMLGRASDQAGVRPGERGIGDFITDHITDPLLAGIAHTIGGVQIWGAMKFSAQRASEPKRGARYVAEQLAKFLKTPADGIDLTKVELHAVGHSAGSIFHSFFVPAVADVAGRSFNSVQFLAPAVRVDTFKETLWPRIAPVTKGAVKAADSLTIYTMKDALERDDVCGPYKKSLLYLIHDGLEPATDEPILGLERSLRDDPELAAGLVTPATRNKGEVFWSITADVTASKKHGDFDDDTPTMNSVARRVLALKPTEKLPQDFQTASDRDPSFFAAVRQCLGDLGKTRSVDIGRLPCGCHASESEHIPPKTSPSLGGAAVNQSPPSVVAGEKRALCIGIDEYPTAALSGCVADAHLWHDTLRARGFKSSLLVNHEATRAGILSAIEQLLTSSKPGEVLVIQYSGHGTTIPDESGDDADGNDQAVCPFDFADGRLLVDDDVAKLFKQLPSGVSLTCFFDCCHSGTITRFAIGDSTGAHGGANRKARFVKATPDIIKKHREFRQSRNLSFMSGPRAFSASRGPVGMREVVFSACRSEEVAFESDGQGEFTRRAIPLLTQGSAMSNSEFQSRVEQAFGAQPAQHPILDCAPEVKDRAMFRND